LKKRLSKEHFEHFREKGWVNIHLGLDDHFIDKVHLALKKMRSDAIINNYKYGRVYFDHLFDFNLAAIELPFNNNICSDIVFKFFQEAKIGSLIKNFIDWQTPLNTLSRLFCMGDYNYRGQWHRDSDYSKSLFDYGNENKIKIDTIQVGLYTEDQFGFRILKKEYEVGGEKSILKKELEDHISRLSVPVNPSPKSYYNVGGRKGTILLFDPRIFHQGSTSGSRFDFHMRFIDGGNKKNFKNVFQDFNVVENLKSDFLNDTKNQISLIKRQSYKLRLFNSINYVLPLYNIFKIFKEKEKINRISNFGKSDVYSNTLYQKK